MWPMYGLFRHCSRLLRLPALALLVLAVLSNPVFTLLGDLHESGQTASGHLHDVSAHETTMAAQGQDDDSKLLHALMHASHCCGHLTGIVAGTHWLPLPLPATEAPVHVLAVQLQHVPVNHFRPPIAA